MNPRHEIDPNLLIKLDQIKNPPSRKTENVLKGRASFLKEARLMVENVSLPEKQRHIGWIRNIHSTFVSHRKENSPMINLLATILLTVTLLFGTGAATVIAAQSSQPDQLLFPVKLLSEETALNLTADPEAKFELALDYVTNRANEMQKLILSGSVPSDKVLTQYQNQIEQATRLAVNLPEDKAIQLLDQLKIRLKTQLQQLLQIHTNASPEAITTMTKTQSMIQEKIQLIETGQTNLLQLRDQIRLQEQLNNPNQQGSATTTSQSSQIAPDIGAGNPWTTGTPTPGSSYGPGPGINSTLTCTPGSGTGSFSTQQQGQSNQSGSQSVNKQPTVIPGGIGGKQ